MNESGMPLGRNSGQRLDDLFRAYHAACEPGEVSANFMPELWQKIEHVQHARFSFRRIARSFVTLAAALSMILAVIGFVPRQNSAPIYSASYVDVLAAHNEALAAHGPAESVQYALELIHPDVSDDGAGEI
jgi:hypothetical protein